MKYIPSGNLISGNGKFSVCVGQSFAKARKCTVPYNPLPCYQSRTKRLKQNPDLKYLSMFSYNATSADAAPVGHGGLSNSSDPKVDEVVG